MVQLGIDISCSTQTMATTISSTTFTKKLANQRVTRWRLFLEEYTPIFHYIKGAQHTVADALSRLPCSER
jgi:hypothetical protein